MIKNIFIFLFFLAVGTVATIAFFKFAPTKIKTSDDTLPKTSFSLEHAPSASLKGEISSLSGSVSYQPRSKDYASTITSPVEIVQGDELSTLGDGDAKISFSKIGEINLMPKTHINIVQTLSQNFVLEITQGQATFQRLGDIPFSVRSLDLVINLDDQTDVAIIADKEASEVLFTVEEGEVTFTYTDTSNETSVIRAKPGKQIIFNNNTKTFSVKYL